MTEPAAPTAGSGPPPPYPDVPVHEPADLGEAVKALRDTSGGLLFTGGGTKLDWAPPAGPVDAVVSTARLDRLVRHDPADATATVQAGMGLADLQRALAPHGQWLALDPPLVDAGATVGGVLACADHGPRYQRYGPVRDLVIGTTVVLADGTVSRSGGNVIKNVAGYDLPKLWCGSLGTLGLVVEITLRLHPLPADSCTVRVDAGAPEATRLALALLAAPLSPSAVDWAEQALWMRFEGRTEAVTAQAEATVRLARGLDCDGAELLTGDEEEDVWARLRAALAGEPSDTVVRGVTRPSALGSAAEGLTRAAERLGVDAVLHSHAGLGVHTARLHGGDPVSQAGVVEAWRAELAEGGGHVTVRRYVAGLLDHTSAWEQPAAAGLMHAVKRAVDPHDRCAPGRRWW